MLTVHVGDSLFIVKQGDITAEDVDVIVNAANPQLAGGGGVDGAIHAAGGPRIAEECRTIIAERGSIATADAVRTIAGALPSGAVIHVVGPVWQGGSAGEEELLRWSYRNALDLAVTAGDASIAFPSLSTGAYGYPVEKAAPVAVGAIVEGLRDHPSIREARLVLFDRATYDVYADALCTAEQGGLCRWDDDHS